MPTPTICTVTGSVINLLGSSVENCTLKVSVVSPFFHPTGNLWVSGELGSVTTDSSGNFSIGVIETESAGGRVRFTFDYYDGVSNRQQKSYSVVVPDQASALLYDLVAAPITPLTAVTFPAASVTVSPISNLSASDAQAAFAEHQTDIDGLTTSLAAKLDNTLASGHVFVGNGSNVATDVAVSGDVTISNAGVTAIASGVIVNADVNASAAIDYSKLNLATSIVNADISASAAIAYSKLALTGAILNADLAGSIADSKLSTISTAGKVSNSATTATSANTNSAIVARDGSGNFSATTITAALTGVASGNLQATANNHGVLISGSGNTATVLAPDASTTKTLISGGSSADPAWGTLAIGGGGTGQTTKAAAFDALSPMSASGDIVYGGASGTGTRLAKGSDGQVLTLASGLPSWAAGMTNPMTTGGDVIYGGASGAPTRLANGSAGQVLTSAGSTSAPTWSGPVVVQVHLASNVTPAAGAAIKFDTADIDTHSAYATGTGLFTVPAGQGGYYQISGAFFANAATTSIIAQKNGSATGSISVADLKAANNITEGGGVAIFNLAAGDTLGLYSTASVAFNGASSPTFNSMSIVKLR